MDRKPSSSTAQPSPLGPCPRRRCRTTDPTSALESGLESAFESALGSGSAGSRCRSSPVSRLECCSSCSTTGSSDPRCRRPGAGRWPPSAVASRWEWSSSLEPKLSSAAHTSGFGLSGRSLSRRCSSPAGSPRRWSRPRWIQRTHREWCSTRTCWSRRQPWLANASRSGSRWTPSWCLRSIRPGRRSHGGPGPCRPTSPRTPQSQLLSRRPRSTCLTQARPGQARPRA